jgi:hypothetical protein
MSENTPHKQQDKAKFIRNVLIKGIALFLVLNFALTLVPIVGNWGRLSLYNWLFPGRFRLPFGENPQEAYNLSLYDLEAMFASHEIDQGGKPESEYRIILIGDSATWGTLLYPEDTLAGLINQAGWTTCDGRTVRAYNLAYPSMSLTKDLMILEMAMAYDPDLILWPVTLESFPLEVQIQTPLVANNPQRIQPLLDRLNIDLNQQNEDFIEENYWDRTLIGRRRAIFDAIQLQYYGAMWAATGIDQTYPTDYSPAQKDFEAGDDQFKGWSPSTLPLDQLAFNVISAGSELAGDTPILLVNEPILISEGENSDIRYNFFYPRWAYDQYREALTSFSANANWDYVDLWDSISPDEFTNSAVHLTPAGSEEFLNQLTPSLEELICLQVVE